MYKNAENMAPDADQSTIRVNVFLFSTPSSVHVYEKIQRLFASELGASYHTVFRRQLISIS